jgi:hypothetical protein
VTPGRATVPDPARNKFSPEGHERDGKVRIIAAAGAKRAELRPDLQTVAEQGVSGFSTTGWFALRGPANVVPWGRAVPNPSATGAEE